jgi:hypothetical protein
VVGGAEPDGSDPAASEPVASVWDEVADVVVAADAADAVDAADLAVDLAGVLEVPLPAFVAVPEGRVDPGADFAVAALTFVGPAVCWFDGGVAFVVGAAGGAVVVSGAAGTGGAAGADAVFAAGVTAGAAGAAAGWLSAAVLFVWLSRRFANSDG